ncbi:MAG: hypothetical protein KA715_12875 [Xanthomonadaceae bacterium]|nr:hypothetical protein [Xanthomonadaceae bacterium]
MKNIFFGMLALASSTQAFAAWPETQLFCKNGKLYGIIYNNDPFIVTEFTNQKECSNSFVNRKYCKEANMHVVYVKDDQAVEHYATQDECREAIGKN